MGLNYTELRAAMAACVRADIAVLVRGAPGIGKTMCTADVAADVKLPLHTLIGSNCDPTDIAGFPHVAGGELRRWLLAKIRACVEAPGLLFLDEITSVPSSVRAPLMRLILELIVGDTALHADSRICAACNPPEMCPNGVELTAAEVNRFVLLDFDGPSIDEIRAYFWDRVGDQGSMLQAEARDFAITLPFAPDLVCYAPPREAIDAGRQFGSPRAWERGLRVWAEAGAQDSRIGRAILDGAVGPEAAAQWLAYRELRKHVASVDDILRDPTTAKVPSADRRKDQVAALGVITRVAAEDKWAAWCYLSRLDGEIATAGARAVATFPAPRRPSKWVRQGQQAEIQTLGRANSVL